MNQGASRLQALALLYAFTFFMAAFLPRLLVDRDGLFARPITWAPGATSIVVALSGAAFLRSAHL